MAETVDAEGADFDRVIVVNLRGIWRCVNFGCCSPGAGFTIGQALVIDGGYTAR